MRVAENVGFFHWPSIGRFPPPETHVIEVLVVWNHISHVYIHVSHVASPVLDWSTDTDGNSIISDSAGLDLGGRRGHASGRRNGRRAAAHRVARECDDSVRHAVRAFYGKDTSCGVRRGRIQADGTFDNFIKVTPSFFKGARGRICHDPFSTDRFEVKANKSAQWILGLEAEALALWSCITPIFALLDAFHVMLASKVTPTLVCVLTPF
jgi:hypothetical protein